MNHIESLIKPEFAWCDEPIVSPDFYYKSVDQAVLAGFIPDSKPPCPHCVAICINYLKKYEVDND